LSGRRPDNAGTRRAATPPGMGKYIRNSWIYGFPVNFARRLPPYAASAGARYIKGAMISMGEKKLEILWDDLTKRKQQEILDMFGDNCNFDVFPLAVLEAHCEETEDMAAGQVLR